MKVLLALDGSEPSSIARDLVTNLAWPPETVVHAISAYQVPVDWTGGFGSSMVWVGEVEDAVRDQLAEDLRTMTSPLSEAGLSVERHVERGRPADVILAAAADLEVDLVIMGSRGRGPIKSMLLGSVAMEVAADAPCPVLVARGSTVTRLLVATDGSGNAERIPEVLASLRVFAGAEADVVAVAVPDSPALQLMVTVYSLGDDRLKTLREQDLSRAGANADEMVERLGNAGIPATARVRSGDPAAQIVEAAQERASDLIVTGSRGLGALERLLLGSVARNILVNAPGSVLIVRATTDDEPAQEEK